MAKINKKIVVNYQKSGDCEIRRECECQTVKEANKEARHLASVIKGGQSCTNIKSFYDIWVAVEIFENIDGEDEFIESYTPRSGYSTTVKGLL